MLEQNVVEYIEQLISANPSIQSIWLFGSRANETQKADSDWDFLVFGTEETLEALIFNQSFHQNHIDLMVVYNGDDFKKPWGEKQKSGSLSEWCWKELSENTATYRATKGIIGADGKEEFNVKVTECNASRIYPK